MSAKPFIDDIGRHTAALAKIERLLTDFEYGLNNAESWVFGIDPADWPRLLAVHDGYLIFKGVYGVEWLGHVDDSGPEWRAVITAAEERLAEARAAWADIPRQKYPILALDEFQIFAGRTGMVSRQESFATFCKISFAEDRCQLLEDFLEDGR